MLLGSLVFLWGEIFLQVNVKGGLKPELRLINICPVGTADKLQNEL